MKKESTVSRKPRKASDVKIEWSELLNIVRVQEDKNEQCLGFLDTKLQTVRGKPLQGSLGRKTLAPCTRVKSLACIVLLLTPAR